MSCETVLISDIAEVVGGGTPSTKNDSFYGGDIPWITPKDLSSFSERYISRGDRNITIDGLKSSSAKLLPKNTVLFTSRAPIGYVAIAKNEVTTNQGFKSLIAKESVDYLYLYYLIKSNIHKFESVATGSTFKEVSGSAVKSVEVNFIPDIKQQRKIAKILGDLDQKIELNRQINQTLEEMAQAIFKSWFVDFEPVKAKVAALENGGNEDDANLAAMQAISGKTADQLATLKTQHPDQYQQLHHTASLFPSAMQTTELGEIPEGWEVIGFEKIAQPKKGKNITKSTVIEGDVPVVAGGLQPAYYHNTPNVFSPVITVSASGANAGYVNLYHNDIWASDCSYISKGQTSYVYSVYCFLKLKQKEIYDMQQGAAQPHVYPKDLHRLQLASPENVVLWIKLEEIIMPLFSIIKNNNKESKTLEELRDTLLPKLLSGQLLNGNG